MRILERMKIMLKFLAHNRRKVARRQSYQSYSVYFMCCNVIVGLPELLVLDILGQWCGLTAICALDSAVTNGKARCNILAILTLFPIFGHQCELVSFSCLEWLLQRGIAPRSLNLKTSLRSTLTTHEWLLLHSFRFRYLTTFRMDHCSSHHFVIVQAVIQESICLTELNVLNVYQTISEDLLSAVSANKSTANLRVLELKFNLVVLAMDSSFFQNLHKFQHLSDLRLVGCSRFSTGIIEQLVRVLWKTLRTLVLHYNVQDHSCAIQLIAAKCVFLEELSLCCFFIDYENLSLLAAQCPRLTRLSLTQCYQIKQLYQPTYMVHADNLSSLAPMCTFPALTHLNVKHNGSWLLPQMIVALLTACPALLSVNLQSSMYQTNNTSIIRHIADRLPALRCLDVSVSAGLSAELAHLVTRCTQLTDVNLQGCDVTNDTVLAIAGHCRTLEVLNLLSNYRITTGAVVQLMDSCLRLRRLQIVRGMYSPVINDLNVDVVKLYANIRNVSSENECGVAFLEVV